MDYKTPPRNFTSAHYCSFGYRMTMNDIYLGFPWIYHVADCFSLQQFMDTIFICLVVACVVAVQHCSLEQACPEAKATKKSIQTLGISWSASLALVTTWTTTWSNCKKRNNIDQPNNRISLNPITFRETFHDVPLSTS